jgi:hypothetical protein
MPRAAAKPPLRRDRGPACVLSGVDQLFVCLTVREDAIT